MIEPENGETVPTARPVLMKLRRSISVSCYQRAIAGRGIATGRMQKKSGRKKRALPACSRAFFAERQACLRAGTREWMLR
jgi:hypothetical protein